LTEIIQNVEVPDRIRMDDSNSLSKVYDIGEEKLHGYECIGKVFSEMLAKGYNLSVEGMIKSSKQIDFVTGPEQYLTIKYKAKIINEVASKYKIITNDTNLELLDTWQGFLRTSIFNEIMDNPATINKLQDFDISEYVPLRKKENNDQTTTSYSYEFYEAEKPEWRNSERLHAAVLSKGFVLIQIDLPVKEVKTAPKETI
jgi:hypothetical protein